MSENVFSSSLMGELLPPHAFDSWVLVAAICQDGADCFPDIQVT